MSLATTPINPDDLVQISMVLPARLASAAQETILRLLATDNTGADTAWAPSPEMHSNTPDAWDMPAWTDTRDDRLRMAWLVADLDQKHVDILCRIHNEPETPTNELLTAAGYAEGTKASGVFRAITSRFRKVNRRPLWHGGEQTPDGQALRSPGPLGDLVGIRLFAEAVAHLHGLTDASTPDHGNDSVDWDAVIANADLSDANIALINAFRAHPDNAATAGTLADHIGYEGHGGANRAMYALGKRLAAARATIDPNYEPRKRADGSTMWWYVVASGEIRDDGLFWWTLRSGLDAAIRRHGI